MLFQKGIITPKQNQTMISVLPNLRDVSLKCLHTIAEERPRLQIMIRKMPNYLPVMCMPPSYAHLILDCSRWGLRPGKPEALINIMSAMPPRARSISKSFDLSDLHTVLLPRPGPLSAPLGHNFRIPSPGEQVLAFILILTIENNHVFIFVLGLLLSSPL